MIKTKRSAEQKMTKSIDKKVNKSMNDYIPQKINVDFNEYIKKSFADNTKSHNINERLPIVIDQYCNDLSHNTDFMNTMMKH